MDQPLTAALSLKILPLLFLFAASRKKCSGARGAYTLGENELFSDRQSKAYYEVGDIRAIRCYDGYEFKNSSFPQVYIVACDKKEKWFIKTNGLVTAPACVPVRH